MTYQPDSRVAYIVQHYSATPMESDFTAADIDAMHRRRGFNEIGYHYFIRKNGLVETGRDLSQSGRFEQGAHSKGENTISIGICCEGGVRKDSPNVGYDSRTPAQLTAQIALIRELLVRFPNAAIVGHRDMPGAATQCPGYDATAWWAGLPEPRASIAQSTTMQASATQVGAAVVTGGTAVSALDGTAQIIAVSACVVIVLAALWIMRERVKKWAGGVQ